MRAETLPLLEIFVRPAPAGLDADIALDVTLISLRAAQAAGYRLSVSLTYGLPEHVETGGLDLRAITGVTGEGDLGLSAHAAHRFFLVLEAGQAFPWTLAPHYLFQDGRAVFFGQSGGTDGLTRVRAALVSGMAAPTAVVAPDTATVYSTRLAERACIMLRSMHGDAAQRFAGGFGCEATLYALMNEDRMHIDHVLVESERSPLQSITDLSEDKASGERLYARLRGR
ncbi:MULTISPECIES: hypothetical protein [unclassified Brevundimonas]|uniref:hypothetical protein n=1 Tax=unclassified Brevundimonas TaxID=2622653 RepID=UPI0025B81D5C|nr:MULTISPECIES: hypothetical protein [unclassified Brevundimonas]